MAETESPVLSSGATAYDIRVAITVGGREIGEYHVGFPVSRFEGQARRQMGGFWPHAARTIGPVWLVALLASISLFYIAVHGMALRREIGRAKLARSASVAHMVAGLAHEIRNPLHAIRLNLYTLSRMDAENHSKLSPEERATAIEQSNQQIDRIEKLMQEMVGFVSRDEPREEVLELRAEVESTIGFVSQEMLRRSIALHAGYPARSVWVSMDPARLRQILLSLLRNAEQAVEEKGEIGVTLDTRLRRAMLTVSDNGPGVAEQDRERIFQPFYTTKKSRFGLGLAVVEQLVAQARGTITCEENRPRGTRFRVELPLVRPPRNRG